MANQKKYKCVLCQKECEGYGNNPAPLNKKGRCCDDCNKKVINKRILAVVNQNLKK